MKLWYKALILVSIPLLAQFVLGGVLLYQYKRVQECQRREDHARKILNTITDVARSVGVAGKWLKRDEPVNKEKMHAALQQVKVFAPAVQQLSELLREDPTAAPAAQTCEKVMGHFLNQLSDVIVSMKKRDLLAVLGSFNEVQTEIVPVLGAVRNAADTEMEICNQLQKQKEIAWRQTTITLAAGVLVNILLACSLLVFFSRSATRHLTNVLTNVDRLAQEKAPLPVLEESDEFSFLDHSLHDLSAELLKQREREKALIAESPAMIFAVSSTGTLTAANPAARRAMFDPETIPNINFADVIDQEDREFCQVITSPPSNETVLNTELRLARSADTTIGVSALWCPLEGQWFCIGEDVTAQKAALERRRQIAVMVNHDLRTPLTAMLAVYDLAKTPVLGELNEDQRRRISAAGVEGYKMLNLINSLLDLEKIAAGKFELNMEDVSLAAALQEATQSSEDVLRSHGLDLRIAVRDELFVRADFKSMVRIISNLLFSAATKSKAGTALSLKAEATAQSLSIILVYTGQPGALSDAQQDFDFELSLCARLTNMHGGELKTGLAEEGNIITRVTLPLEPKVELAAQAC